MTKYSVFQFFFFNLGELRSPGAKNQGEHQPIEMKLAISHYHQKAFPDPKI